MPRILLILSPFLFLSVAHANLIANPPFLNFGTVSVDQPSFQVQTVFVQNQGRTSVILQTTDVGCIGDFSTNGGTCFGELAAGSECSIEVQFQPHSTGFKECQLNISDNAGDDAFVSLEGTGQ